MSMEINSTNAYKPLNVCPKNGNIQELRNVFVAPPDQLQPVTDHIAKRIGRQDVLSTLGLVAAFGSNSGGGQPPWTAGIREGVGRFPFRRG